MTKTFTDGKEAANFCIEQYPSIFADYGSYVKSDDEALEVLSMAEDEGVCEPDGENETDSMTGKWTVKVGPSEVAKGYKN